MIGCRHASAVSCVRWVLAGLPDPEGEGNGGRGAQVKGEQIKDPLARSQGMCEKEE